MISTLHQIDSDKTFMKPWAQCLTRFALIIASVALISAAGCSVDKLSIDGGKFSPFRQPTPLDVGV